MIAAGGVCDECNQWLGRQIDAPFANRFDMKLTRGLERLRGRGGIPSVIEGRDATARLTIELDGRTVVVDAARADERDDGGLDIEVRPLERDPQDVVARTIRALWKIALGSAYLAHGRDALDPRWDHLRRAVLGAPFKGFLLQMPFTAQITRLLDVNVNLSAPADPEAMTFAMGGVAFAVPLADRTKITRATVRQAGWDIHTTDKPAPTRLLFRLQP